MNILQIVILILVVSGSCFLMFQLWYYYENYEYIVEFNKTYRRLEYSSSPNISYVDKSVRDPNDNEFKTEEKSRCVLYNGSWFGIFGGGFIGDDSTSIGKGFNDKIDCIDNIFDIKIPIVYNPCIMKNDNDCKLLKKLMEDSQKTPEQ